MAGNRNLNDAARAKKDEFYTQLTDIEKELCHYMKFFEGKTVLCNCDDPYESQFFRYFALNFNFLKLKKLIATCYAGSPIVQTELDFWGTPNENPQFDKRKTAIRLDVNEIRDYNGDGFTDLADVKWLLENNRNVVTYLEGDGDFRSPECVAALEEADIVVTNPPFSLFRQYVKQLVDFKKKFLIIGNINAITYKEIFPLIMQNKLWLGYGFAGMVGFFKSPYEDTAAASEHREGMIRNSGVHWFTNLEHEKRNRPLDLTGDYELHPEQFPHYDNYDAIEVSKTGDIPEDYLGVMGVPITFLDKYCPAQFEIVGNAGSYGVDGYSLCPALYIGGKKIYKRILIRRRQK